METLDKGDDSHGVGETGGFITPENSKQLEACELCISGIFHLICSDSG